MAVDRPLEDLSSADLFKGAAAPDPAPEPVAAAPEPEPPSPEPPAAVTPPAEPPAPQPQPEPPVAEPPAHIPAWRLREEADARRAAEDRVRQLEERQRQYEAARQQEKVPDFFENPEVATRHLMAQTLRPYIEAQEKAAMYNSRLVANSVHTADAVNKAEEAFMKARDEGILDPVDYERVVQSPNRYDAAVQWHKKHVALSTVGDDPNAWLEKQLEARMADPKFQAAFLEKIKGTAAVTNPGTTVQLPPSLSRVPSARGNGQENLDPSDKGLWDFATKR